MVKSEVLRDRISVQDYSNTFFWLKKMVKKKGITGMKILSLAWDRVLGRSIYHYCCPYPEIFWAFQVHVPGSGL